MLAYAATDVLAGPLRRGLLAQTHLLSRHFTARVPTHEDDTHEDFKPKFNPDAEPRTATTVEDQIKRDITDNTVFLYMKGIPEAPQCGFSNMACRILDAYGVKYGTRNVLADPDIREGVKAFSKWPTIPQVYIKGEFVGGSDLLMSMHQNGELTEALEGTEKASAVVGVLGVK